MRGRRKALDPAIQWSIMIPSTLAAQVELILFDPLRGKTGFGTRSRLVSQLLKDWLELQKGNKDEPRTDK